MEIIRSIIIGAIQGVSEFLPISSSGHLVVIPYIFHWNYQGLAFDVALHFGTVLALLAYFWRDWTIIIRQAFATSRQTNSTSYPKNLLWQIIVASIPAAILGIFLNDYVETKLHSPLLIAFDLAFFGWLLWWSDKKATSISSGNKYPFTLSHLVLSHLVLSHSILIGLAQAASLFPGVSRSGITMTAGRKLGLDRESAARFSFLLGTPAMLGAFVFKFKDIESADLNLSFWFGVAAATIFGFFAIKYLLEYLKRSDFGVFMWYRIALALVLLGLYFVR